MWQQQEIAGRLVNVIQQVQSRRETGQLTAWQGNNAGAEEGIIVFVNGKITDARVGRRTGSDALNRLSNWENCFYRFVRPGDDAASSQPSSSLDWSSGTFTDPHTAETPPPYSSTQSPLPRTGPLG